MSRLHLTILAALTAIACNKPAPQPAPKQAPSPEVEVAEEEPHPLLQMRQAFGLPMPPEVTYVHKFAYIDVGTTLMVSELREFFAQRLVDYETIEVTPFDVRFVSLHSAGVDVRIFRRSARGDTIVRYSERVDPTERAKTSPHKKLKPGDAVETRLSDGRLLAPGAVYGQSYTPEPGDPLYQERYRANFGKPYGSWVLN